MFGYISTSGQFDWIDGSVIAGIVVLYLIGVLFYPLIFLRPISWLFLRTIYRLKATGQENIPTTGPVLLLSNHVTFIDWLLIWSACPRKVRFVAWAGWMNHRVFRWFIRSTDAILIYGQGGPKQLVRSLRQIVESLDAGEVVCLFPEGALTRGGGQMLPFRRGFEKLLRDTKHQVPIIPVCLHQLWGSIFSYSRGKVLWKLPKRIPYPVRMIFGAPMPSNSTAGEIRQVIMSMDADAAIEASRLLLPVHRRFVRVAAKFRNLRRTAWVDASAGSPREFTFAKALVGAICMAKWLKSRIGTQQHVGLWLPTSAGSALGNIALQFLHRVTVNLNYTAGADALQSSVRQTGMDVVITSKRFLSRMPLNVEGVTIVYLEDALAEIGKWQKLFTMLKVALLPGWVLDRWILGMGKHSIDDVATIIFSSGSTGEPKGVMLTQQNLAGNIAGVVDHLTVVPKDRLLGVLPFFHSFGYTVLLWMPLQVGASCVMYPDPRQAKEIGELCKKFACTGFVATATFLRFYIRRCEPDDFKTLRFLVCGAERLPPSLAEEFHQKFGILPLEGYGTTELTPAVAVSTYDEEIAGIRQVRYKYGSVGQPIPGVAVQVRDEDTNQVLPPGAEGMLWVKGPNVMKGYLHQPEQTAKVVQNGWYKTGDMARIDDDGFITITGRISRFAKIAGEMVPIERVEDELLQCVSTSERYLAVSSVVDEKRGERLIVLYLETIPIQIKDALKLLQERGLPNLWIPGERDCYETESLPLLGTGKLDLKAIKQLAIAATGSPG
ncbi:MAG: AMP-binding protein [Zavarzinella sp.]